MPKGNRFGEIAVREGFASRKAVRSCLEIQSKLKSFGVEPKRLGEIMVEKGFLTEEDVRAILDVQKLGGSRMDSRSGVINEASRVRRLYTSQVEATKDMPIMPKIPGYVILELLGEGGMGVVYKARQESLDRIVAIKVLPSRAAKETTFIKRFLAEARTVARLNHENIIGGIDVGEADGTYYFVMEHVEGESVADLIRRKGYLEERVALQITAQMARALQHAHKHGLVHRDVKPQNILLTRNNLAKLCDMGLAKVQSEQQGDAAGVPVGTPHYLSPEQARGEADVDIRSDIYSLGASLYHMLTGVTPFEGESPMVLMTKHLTEDPLPPRKHNGQISRGASELVQRMMAKEKEDRHQTPGELLDDVERVLEGKRITGAGGSARAKRPRSARRSGTRPRLSESSAASSRGERDRGAERERDRPRPPRVRSRTVRGTASNETVSLLLIPLALLVVGGIIAWYAFAGGANLLPPPKTPPTAAEQQRANDALTRYRSLETEGRVDEAADGYRSLLQSYPDTHAAGLARDYLADLEQR
ncbi:MAG: serine/threonine protein kinase [Planctomycetes bacterium]|nr:serine/threonine protein kinase [Planctomycetota bacterium]